MRPGLPATDLPSARLRLLLIGSIHRRLEASRGLRHRGEEGASLVLVLIIVLTLILGSVALAGRTFFSQIGSVFQVQGREARSAAELGATWSVSRLNLEQNRPMLVTSKSTNETTFTQPQTTWPAGSIPNSLCGNKNVPNTGTQASLDPNTATAAYEEWFVDANGAVTATQPTGNYRSFRILGVRRPSQNGIDDGSKLPSESGGLRIWRNRDFGNLASSGTQPFFLQVEGSSFRNGVRIASTTLEQEFEVVPKCCGRSFGGKHGSDLYNENNQLPGEAAVCVPNSALGFGLLAGAGPGSGTVELKGTPNFITGVGTDVDPIFCLIDKSATNPSSCSVQVSGQNPPTVSFIDANIGLPDTFTQATGISPAPTAQQLENCKTSCPSNSTSTQGTINDSTTFTSYAAADLTNAAGQVIISKGDTIVNASTLTQANLPANCSLTSTTGITPPIETIHCNVSRLDPDQGDIVFRTSVNRRLILYFPNADPGKTTYIVDSSGNDEIINLRCDAGNPLVCTRPSLTDNPPYPVTTLTMYGCVTAGCGPQTIYLRGTPSTLFSFFWFPFGTLDYGGTADFTGIAWTENLLASGVPTFTIPGSGIGAVLCQIGAIECAANPVPPDTNPPFFDWVARATNRFRILGN